MTLRHKVPKELVNYWGGGIVILDQSRYVNQYKFHIHKRSPPTKQIENRKTTLHLRLAQYRQGTGRERGRERERERERERGREREGERERERGREGERERERERGREGERERERERGRESGLCYVATHITKL